MIYWPLLFENNLKYSTRNSIKDKESLKQVYCSPFLSKNVLNS